MEHGYDRASQHAHRDDPSARSDDFNPKTASPEELSAFANDGARLQRIAAFIAAEFEELHKKGDVIDAGVIYGWLPDMIFDATADYRDRARMEWGTA